MPAPHPPAFRQRAVELDRMREMPVAEIAVEESTRGNRVRPGGGRRRELVHATTVNGS